MSHSDQAPEEQETIQKSKDPSNITTAISTTHTTEEATVHVCDLDMFVQVQLMKEITPRYCRMVICTKKTITRIEWHPGQPSYLVKNDRSNNRL